MTEFEYEVAQALLPIIARALPERAGEPLQPHNQLAVALAPRVAAAILAHRFGEPDEIARQRWNALHALRGGM